MSSSVESDDQLDDELKSAKKFIQSYRQKVLNLDKGYRTFYENNCSTINGTTQASLTSLQNSLKEYKMYISDFQSKQQQLEKQMDTVNRHPKGRPSYIGKLFNLKSGRKQPENSKSELRTYLNHSNTHLNPHLNTNTHTNQQLIREIDELSSKLNQRLELENYFKQNFCNCRTRNILQSNHNDANIYRDEDKASLRMRSLSKELKQNAMRADAQTAPRDYSANESGDRSRCALNADSKDQSDRSQITDEDLHESLSEFVNRNETTLDLSYMYDTSSVLSYSLSTDLPDDEDDDDQYLDTYTIESANTEENPISTDNYTKIIRKLTRSDVMRQRLLEVCNQSDALDFEQEFCKENYPTILNLDSGTFAVTFLALDKHSNLIVLKVIRTISKDIQAKFNQLTYSGSETFDEVYSEVMISKTLSSLHDSQVNRAHCYPKILFAKLVSGKIPDNFTITKLKDSKPDQVQGLTIEQFYDAMNKNRQLDRTRSWVQNERKRFLKQEPFKLFPDAPIEYTVIAMKYVGKPIWKRLLNRQLTAQQLFSIAQQLIFSLACAEQQFNFEHRDLHISNILIKRTKKPEVEFIINNQVYKLSTYGYRCFIVDMTFSRLTINNQVFYKDLSAVLHKRHDNENGKKLKMQDMVYQLMRDEIGENWQKFRPRTNIHWLIYVLKTIKSCELFKRGNELIGQLLADYSNHASQCYNLTELINYIVERSS